MSQSTTCSIFMYMYYGVHVVIRAVIVYCCCCCCLPINSRTMEDVVRCIARPGFDSTLSALNREAVQQCNRDPWSAYPPPQKKMGPHC